MPEPIHEVLPGVLHYATEHPNIGADVSSYYLVEERVLIDPLTPPDGAEWFEGREPRAIILTNRHHLRDAVELGERFGAPVHAPRTGMHELPGDKVQPYDFGDELPGGITPHGVLESWPDETALEIPAHDAVAVADGLLHYGGLGFMPDKYLGDNAEHEKAELREAWTAFVDKVEFENLLPAHGAPLVGGARDAVRSFVTSE